MDYNRARRQTGFPTFISCQREDANVLPERRQSHQGDKLCDVSTVSLVARWPVFLARWSDADGEPHCWICCEHLWLNLWVITSIASVHDTKLILPLGILKSCIQYNSIVGWWGQTTCTNVSWALEVVRCMFCRPTSRGFPQLTMHAMHLFALGGC